MPVEETAKDLSQNGSDNTPTRARRRNERAIRLDMPPRLRPTLPLVADPRAQEGAESVPMRRVINSQQVDLSMAAAPVPIPFGSFAFESQVLPPPRRTRQVGQRDERRQGLVASMVDSHSGFGNTMTSADAGLTQPGETNPRRQRVEAMLRRLARMPRPISLASSLGSRSAVVESLPQGSLQALGGGGGGAGPTQPSSNAVAGIKRKNPATNFSGFWRAQEEGSHSPTASSTSSSESDSDSSGYSSSDDESPAKQPRSRS